MYVDEFDEMYANGVSIPKDVEFPSRDFRKSSLETTSGYLSKDKTLDA